MDTSALIAIIKQEQMMEVCTKILSTEPVVIISAGTLVEARIVATKGKRITDLDRIIAASMSEIVPVTADRAHLAAEAYAQWGKTFHKAALNFGDCFAYATAKEFDCPLLYVGNDFAQTDIRPAISTTPP